MKLCKKLLCAVLSVAMLFSMSTTAFAAVDQETYEALCEQFDGNIATLNEEVRISGFHDSYWADSQGTRIDGYNTKEYTSYYPLAKELAKGETDPYKAARIFANYVKKVCNIKNNCAGAQTEFNMLCNAYGIPCVSLDGFAYENSTDGDLHGWNAFYANCTWHYVDCLWMNKSGQYFDMTREFAAQRRAGSIEWPSDVITVKGSDWAIDDIRAARSERIITKAVYENLKHDNWNNIMYTAYPCNREAFAVLAINTLVEYYSIDHHDERSMGVGCTYNDWIPADDGIDALLAKFGKELPAEDTFTDTTSRYVRAANALGIIGGYGNGKFGPKDSLTREQAAAILARTAKVIGLAEKVDDTAKTAAVNSFADKGKISSWAMDSIGYVKAIGVMQGTTTTTFAPTEPYTGEQAIITMLRLLNYARSN